MRAAGALLVAVIALAACGSVPAPQTAAEARRERMVDLNDSGRRAVARGELRRATAYYGEALRLAEEIEDFRSIAVNALNLAATWQAQGDAGAAALALDRVLASPARFERRLVSEAAGRKALLELQAGRIGPADDWLRRAEEECVAAGCTSRTALVNLRGQILLQRGEAAEARAAARGALAASRAEGNREEEANALRLDGRAAVAAGEPAAGSALLHEALAIDKQIALPGKIAQDLLALAEMEMTRGDPAAARSYAQRALDVARASGNVPQQDSAHRMLERAR